MNVPRENVNVNKIRAAKAIMSIAKDIDDQGIVRGFGSDYMQEFVEGDAAPQISPNPGTIRDIFEIVSRLPGYKPEIITKLAQLLDTPKSEEIISLLLDKLSYEAITATINSEEAAFTRDDAHHWCTALCAWLKDNPTLDIPRQNDILQQVGELQLEDSSAHAQVETSLSEWKEPYHHMDRSIVNYLPSEIIEIMIVNTLEKKLLSERAILFVFDLSLQGEGWGEKMVNLGNGNSETLSNLSVRMLEQSYELACSSFNEPALALLSMFVLFQLGNQTQNSAQYTLERLSNKNGLASSRFCRFALVHGGPYKILLNKESFTAYLLQDLRTLVQQKQHSAVEMLINDIFLLDTVLGTTDSTGSALELAYLISEHLLENGRYTNVIRLPTLFSRAWDVSARDKTYQGKHRQLQICIARALEATGDLLGAKELYEKYGCEEKQKELEGCISGETMYWSQQLKFSLPWEHGKWKFIAACELAQGLIGFFFEITNGCKVERIEFYTMRLDVDLEPRQQTLPHAGKRWNAVQVVPTSGTEPLRVLVRPQDGPESFFAFEYMHSTFGLSSTSNEPPLYVELWEYDGSSWAEIVTRGNIPDSKKLGISFRNSCSYLQGKLVLFGGMSLGFQQEDTQAKVFILDLSSKEWFHFPSPYKTAISVDQAGRPVGPLVPIFPAFSAISAVKTDFGEAIVMLRNGKPFENKKQENELVPKFAVDLFGLAEPQMSHPDQLQCWWNIDVPTRDRSGYVAYYMSSTALQIKQHLLVIGTGNIFGVQYAGTDGMRKFDPLHSQQSKASINVLELEKMEWRSTTVHNNSLLHCKLEGAHLLGSRNGNDRYLVARSSKELFLFCLHNSDALHLSLNKPISTRKMCSKKNTLSYQLKEAKRQYVSPKRACASCHAFEFPGVMFPCCAKCRRVFYCSRKCQSRHWKQSHKKECVQISAAPSDIKSEI